ncbi:MAG: peptidase T [Promethearchaeota archaeon Loki_b32]|nr:MAG: peptidase T [Candidatus Lokiarchaeota archaeon Loki_b32]
MELTKEIQKFLLNDALERFLRYVKIWTTSDESAESVPSTKVQLDLGKVLVEELKELNLDNIVLDEYGFVYAYLPPSKGFENVQSFGLLAHIDTSPAVSGKDVKPVIHRNYDGKNIKFAQDKDLILTFEDSPNLEEYIGLDIITSEGDTLLGADDKAGIAEIMAACNAWRKFDKLKHGPIYICFTPDEEIGLGIDKVDKNKIPEICYTVDGGEMGEMEFECFDAWLAQFKFKGLSVHPGHAKNKMINAIQIASRYFSELPESEAPESTEEREGYFHLAKMQGGAEEATARMIIRDFILKNNQRRMDYIKSLKQTYEIRYPGLKIEIDFKYQYQNMVKYIEKKPIVVDLVKQAMEKVGLEVKTHPIRGGTDGARLSVAGIPTPNIFTGGQLFHSRKEYIPTLALQKSAEVLLYLAHLWTQQK